MSRPKIGYNQATRIAEAPRSLSALAMGAMSTPAASDADPPVMTTASRIAVRVASVRARASSSTKDAKPTNAATMSHSAGDRGRVTTPGLVVVSTTSDAISHSRIPVVRANSAVRWAGRRTAATKGRTAATTRNPSSSPCSTGSRFVSVVAVATRTASQRPNRTTSEVLAARSSRTQTASRTATPGAMASLP